MRRAGAWRERRVLSARWRVIVSEPASGASNMGVDASLLAAVASRRLAPTLRFYAWAGPTISIGRNQPDPDPEALLRMQERGIGWVRRPTGGRAVYHGGRDEELTYSVVAPLDTHPFGASWRAGYDAIHRAIADGLRSIGVAAVVTPRRRIESGGPIGPRSRLACYAASVPGEITAGEKKLVGSAQRRTRTAVLQHGSIPLSGDPSILNEVWPGSLDADRVATVSAAAGRNVSRDAVIGAIVTAIENRLEIDFDCDETPPSSNVYGVGGVFMRYSSDDASDTLATT